MGRVCMVRDLVAELVMGQVCYGPSLSWVDWSSHPIHVTLRMRDNRGPVYVMGRVCYGPRCPGIS